MWQLSGKPDGGVEAVRWEGERLAVFHFAPDERDQLTYTGADGESDLVERYDDEAFEMALEFEATGGSR